LRQKRRLFGFKETEQSHIVANSAREKSQEFSMGYPSCSRVFFPEKTGKISQIAHENVLLLSLMPSFLESSKRALIIKHGGSRCVEEDGVSPVTVGALLKALDSHNLRQVFAFEAHVVGGGPPVKAIQRSMEHATSDQRDEAVREQVWEHARQLGRILLSAEKQGRSLSELPKSPQELETLVSTLEPKRKIAVASFLEKGRSTDTAAVEFGRLFETYHQATSLLLILTDQKGIYEADPRSNTTARQIRRATVTQLIEAKILVVGAWQALMKVIIDPVAVQFLYDHPLQVYITEYDNYADIVALLKDPRQAQTKNGTFIDPLHTGPVEFYHSS
jgi:uridylate kinase